MRVTPPALLAFTLLLLPAAPALADDDKLAAQKKTAQENWDTLGLGDPAHLETAHLLIHAPKSYEKRVKEIGAALERHYEQARKALGYDTEEPLPGKVAVYLLPEREQFTAFVRRVEKRRLQPEDAGSHQVEGDFPHVAAGPPQAKTDAPVEGQAGEQLARAVLVKKAGVRTPLPLWLTAGFGRATTYRASPRDRVVAEERKRAAALLAKNRWTAGDVWGGTLGDEEAAVLQASLADFLAYGPGASKFAEFVEGFRPEEGQERRTTEQALESANLTIDRVSKIWREWAPNPK
jgi:hypothetical protein